ncbi:DUF4148 domain-containing protein [Caballeronia sp. ATUFL_M2_KS44]|uniref:DUF4148 domain-containing protein n=1 Tax=Caballeronia sp. ATUFL_M2_KS44 TaxID=2921767 RepID=UPI00253F9326|nr:DUF4148 domain-containing protein [Caballeronia sp. ATUFL_M2_KS44]
MKRRVFALLAVAALLPMSSFAQSTTGDVTRAQVRGDLQQLEAAGYRPSTHESDYPQALASVEAKVAAMREPEPGYGGASTGEQASGGLPARVHTAH